MNINRCSSCSSLGYCEHKRARQHAYQETLKRLEEQKKSQFFVLSFDDTWPNFRQSLIELRKVFG